MCVVFHNMYMNQEEHDEFIEKGKKIVKEQEEKRWYRFLQKIRKNRDRKIDHINKKIPPNIVIFSGHFCEDAVKIAFSSPEIKPTCNCHEYSQEEESYYDAVIIQCFIRISLSKKKANDLRSIPDNLFDPEFSLIKIER